MKAVSLGLALALVLLCVLPLAYSRATLYLGDATIAIADTYMVVLQPNTTAEARDAHIAQLLAASSDRAGPVQEQVTQRWSTALVGYAATLNKATLATLLEDPLVQWVEQDQVVTLQDDTQEEQIQTDPAAWGLRRIDQREFYYEDDTYTYWASAGDGVDVYIVDTGIQTTHEDFGERAIVGVNTVPGETDQDCNGHGTHVASTAAGFEYGVAKKSTLIAVKVLGCGGSGTWSGVISGVDWVAQSYASRQKPSVANMSLGGGISATVDAAVAASIAAGVSFAVAAGNNNYDACSFSPARVPTAVTVAASTYTRNADPTLPSAEYRASFSNYGPCSDIFAPGQNIKAAWIGASNIATSTISGTSMASPHVAGVIAVRLGHTLATTGEAEDPAQISSFIKSTATPDKITNAGLGTPNLQLYSPFE